MTDNQINRLLELQKRFDAGEISKDMFDLGVAAIRGADKSNANSSQADTKPVPYKKRNIIIAVISAVVILLSLGLFLLLHNKDKGEVQMGPMNMNFPDDYTVMNVVERYCTAISENDFTTLASLYAPTVERYQDAYNKDRDYVIGCHQRYDNTFKVHGKHSSIRRETFKMEPISNDRVSVVVVEDYSIDREDKSKYSVFVLEKHFVIDSAYHIVSVYDNQISKSKGTSDYQAIYQAYVKEHEMADMVDDFGGWEYIYLDGDDIPELVISTGYPATGAYVLSIANGRVVESFTSSGFSYIPRKGKILSGRGFHMGQNIMYLESFGNGKITTLYTINEYYGERDWSEEEPDWYIDDRHSNKTTVDKYMNDFFFKFGNPVKAGSDGKNLRPMEDLWQ